MKKTLLIALLFVIGASSLRATLIWYEPFQYANGGIDVVSANGTNGVGVTNWGRFSGSSTLLISNLQATIVASSTAEGVCRLFPAIYTNAQAPVYASFTLIVKALPTAGGSYFTMFEDSPGGDYIGRFFCLTGTNLTTVSNTFRLGCAAGSAAANKIFPMDLATNVPYQVVVEYDTGNVDASLWVNPVSSSDAAIVSGDTLSGTLQSKIIGNIALRQTSATGGYIVITNMATATTFDDAATNVGWSRTPVAPTILVQPPATVSGFVGVSNGIAVLAYGQSPLSLVYQWMTNGVPITNPQGNTNVFSFPSPMASDGGAYSVIVSNPSTTLSVTSTVANVSFTTYTGVPAITSPAANTTNTVYPGGTATLSVTAVPPAPTASYQWLYNGSAIGGATASTLTISDVTVGNGTVGLYTCQVYNTTYPSAGTNTSHSIFLTNAYPIATTLSQLRSLVDPVYFLPTNTTAYYTVTGTVVNVTNMAVSPNYQLAITDGNVGISVYGYGYNGLITNSPGDVVRVTGPVGIYNSLEEFDIYSTDPTTSITTISSNNPAPLPKVLPLSFTNSPAYGGTSNALYHYESTLVMLTNVYFQGANGSNTFSSTTYTVTDQSGSNSILVYIYYGFTNIINTTVPTFCYTLTGVMSEYLGNTATNRSSGFEFWPTDISEIVTNAPSPVTITETNAGKLTWTAVPYSYSYSVYYTTNANSPYLPLKTGLVFSNTTGFYTDTTNTAAMRLYQVTSP